MKLEIRSIKKKYGKKAPLVDVSFCLSDGQCVGIIGKNGIGKSTLLSILAGVQNCDGGNILYFDNDMDPCDLIKNRRTLADTVGYVPQGTPLLEELSARDNLLLWYDIRTLKAELDGGVLDMLGIGEFLTIPVRKMSGGMKKRLSIGCSMAKKPKILLLDEPCSALDLVCKQDIHKYLSNFKASGGAIVITTHDESDLALCDVVYILKDGILTPYQYDGDIDRLAGML